MTHSKHCSPPSGLVAVLLGVVTLLAPTAAPVGAQADVPPPDYVFWPPLEPAETFGRAVSTDGTVIAALGTRHVALYARTGEFPTWALQDAFPLWSSAAGGVAVQGERLLVGETTVPAHPQGVARVFRRSGAAWPDEAVLLPSDGAPGDAFGTSVALDGSTAVIGAPSHAGGGAVYVYTRGVTGWTERAVLVADDTVAGDAFGTSVGVSGDVIVVGAPDADVGALADAGAAYTYTGGGASWTERARLVEPGGTAGGNFGISVAADGDTVLVGAPNADTPAAVDAGAAYAFVRSGEAWSLQAQLASPEGESFDLAGWSLDLDGDRAVCGAWFASDPHFGYTWSGKLQTHRRVGGVWSHAGDLYSPTQASGAHMGYSAAVGGDTTVGGAPYQGNGSLHVFSVGIDLPPWLDLGYGLAGAGGVPSLVGSGTLQTGSPGSLTLDGAARGAPALGLVAITQAPTPFKGGTLVPLPPQLLLITATDANGSWVATWSSFPAAPGGLPFYVQFAVADAGAPHGAALSNALAGVTH
ncbi:MAG: FG-GAP repeat protein [Planctomycetota bacterium]|jgi:hypothetical protein